TLQAINSSVRLLRARLFDVAALRSGKRACRVAGVGAILWRPAGGPLVARRGGIGFRMDSPRNGWSSTLDARAVRLAGARRLRALRGAPAGTPGDRPACGDRDGCNRLRGNLVVRPEFAGSGFADAARGRFGRRGR